MDQEDLEDVRKTLKLLRDGHYSFARADTYCIRDLAKILVYIDTRLTDLELKHAPPAGADR